MAHFVNLEYADDGSSSGRGGGGGGDGGAFCAYSMEDITHDDEGYAYSHHTYIYPGMPPPRERLSAYVSDPYAQFFLPNSFAGRNYRFDEGEGGSGSGGSRLPHPWHNEMLLNSLPGLGSGSGGGGRGSRFEHGHQLPFGYVGLEDLLGGGAAAMYGRRRRSMPNVIPTPHGIFIPDDGEVDGGSEIQALRFEVYEEEGGEREQGRDHDVITVDDSDSEDWNGAYAPENGREEQTSGRAAEFVPPVQGHNAPRRTAAEHVHAAWDERESMPGIPLRQQQQWRQQQLDMEARLAETFQAVRHELRQVRHERMKFHQEQLHFHHTFDNMMRSWRYNNLYAQGAWQREYRTGEDSGYASGSNNYYYPPGPIPNGAGTGYASANCAQNANPPPRVYDVATTLAAYNNAWTAITTANDRSNRVTSSPIPWPTWDRKLEALSHTANQPYTPQEIQPFLFQPFALQKWNAFVFYLALFDLKADWRNESNTDSDDPGATDEENRGNGSVLTFFIKLDGRSRHKVEALRAQLQLEKKRWHEDRLAMWWPRLTAARRMAQGERIGEMEMAAEAKREADGARAVWEAIVCASKECNPRRARECH
ncbi:hypothetical protein AJ80_08093 [Polytolypa hystricis UAMH7299]|uniref:Uncharacterized protein n=1 Tax=Polytolypa hystricis (strain UAMH7299) TaxID=1447883 RepID=A0A2B7XD34_POLH7|nr:hypothetical protein AJ80_08093 [Polytolypa hystricis UAMH7299]